jgi:transcriptional antiterminator RfaH
MHWYAVRTKPNRERQAELSLQRLGLATFYPQMKQRRVIRRKEQMIIRSLFPGYLFARLNMTSHYRAAKYARGVLNLVAFGSIPAIVDDEIIEGMRARLRDGCVTLPAPPLTPGEVVRIQAGPLQGLEAVFERGMSDHQRVVLLLRTLTYQARVVLPVEQVANT